MTTRPVKARTGSSILLAVLTAFATTVGMCPVANATGPLAQVTYQLSGSAKNEFLRQKQPPIEINSQASAFFREPGILLARGKISRENDWFLRSPYRCADLPLFRYPAHGVNDLVVCLGVIQL